MAAQNLPPSFERITSTSLSEIIIQGMRWKCKQAEHNTVLCLFYIGISTFPIRSTVIWFG